MKKWFAQAPANIALIKYMGKADDGTNVPVNPSLSYTLPDLLSFVELEQARGSQDSWSVLQLPGASTFALSDSGSNRYLAHLQFLKNHFGYSGAFKVRSCNNFPMATGLASSASSFAALTIAANRALSELTNRPELPVKEMAELSRQGSGSSCRSFYTPWALWDEQGAHDVTDLAYTKLIHHAVIVSHNEKSVSSSEAHSRVKTSPEFKTRITNATTRLQTLLRALRQEHWARCYELVREDFLEMHALFTTANPPFKYISLESQRVLDDVQKLWDQNRDGPLVTMDAGPNVHLLFRPDQQALADGFKQSYIGIYDVL